ncbi:MAG: ABC transporter substrate-binding protein, partial [Planctomycetes bacterium]|nr:ABC transporter substrate-binding protein [Planctomycetota bacterium]
HEIHRQVAEVNYRPTVVCIEWLGPLMSAGNWVPELVELAGGTNLLSVAGQHSPWMTLADVKAADPDLLVLMPCGWDIARTRAELQSLSEQPGWYDLHAVRNGRVFLTDGNQYFNRPGPRLVDSAEILAELIHPALLPQRYAGQGWLPY